MYIGSFIAFYAIIAMGVAESQPTLPGQDLLSNAK